MFALIDLMRRKREEEKKTSIIEETPVFSKEVYEAIYDCEYEKPKSEEKDEEFEAFIEKYESLKALFHNLSFKDFLNLYVKNGDNSWESVTTNQESDLKPSPSLLSMNLELRI